jgi:ubiquinone/menaquinone biosynthesis C-methylase UbiE
MDLLEIRKHWQNWATQFGTDLRATTKTSTAKKLEIDALARAIRAIVEERGPQLDMLEVGCGNGQNCLRLAEAFPQARVTGVDFIEEMIEAANQLKVEAALPDERLSYRVGNVLDLDVSPAPCDVIFTDRCLINLNTDALQHQAIGALAGRLKPNGYLLMIENSKQTHRRQNDARELVGLPRRPAAEFNHFVDESTLFPFLPTVGLHLVDVEDFISLHDLVLYVLVPMTNGGVVDYEHPLIDAATQLNMALSHKDPGSLGTYGQNRLYKCQKGSSGRL